MTIGKKIYGGFIIILLILLSFAVTSIIQVDKVSKEYQHMIDYRIKQSQLASDIQLQVASQGLFARAYVLSNDEVSLSNLETRQQLLKDRVEELSTMVSSKEMKGFIKEIQDTIPLFDKEVSKVIDHVKKGQEEQAIVLINTVVNDANRVINEAAGGMVAYQDEHIAQERKVSEEATLMSKRTLILGTIIDVILGLIIATVINWTISRPVRRLAKATSIISEGDLSQEDIVIKSKDELRDLANSFNTMKQNLRNLIGSINDNALHVTSSAEELSASTEEVTIASKEVSSNMESMWSGAQTTATSSKESSMAMEETASGVQRIAESAQGLLVNAVETEKLAGDSQQSVKSAKEQMGLIYDSSYQTNELIKQLSKQTIEIENITRVITDITEQTNLLALNAAIEAARAGEHGKGFAVVADEVRKLAEQSKFSATQIVNLTMNIQNDTRNVEQAVSESLKNVDQGVQVIEDAGTAFSTIVSAVQTMNGQIEEISAATEEISASAEQVVASVQEIAAQSDTASSQAEQNSAAVQEQLATMEEINSVASDLSKQAVNLQEIIQQFKI
ncbi:methyl-accepting chemotaxis protein [Psychrobacillus sp. NPDC096389]|uniref:methyl-accepting chemotaxis protein n=1 Tax=Psychrobacillus sp. NPDC096389 TaxID=3364490 RepID=UPI003827CB6A